jgi:hypothetical protein
MMQHTWLLDYSAYAQQLWLFGFEDLKAYLAVSLRILQLYPSTLMAGQD